MMSGPVCTRHVAIRRPTPHASVGRVMKLISLNCNHCGAPLEVPESAKFVTCSFCETQLKVERTASTYSTAAIAELKETTDSLSQDVAYLKLQNSLQVLEHGWDRQRQTLMTRKKDGSTRGPSSQRAVLVGIAPMAVGVVILFAGLGSPSGGAILFGLAAIVIGIIAGVTEHSRRTAYEHAQRRYSRKRAAIRTEMQAIAPFNAGPFGQTADQNDRPFPGLP